MRVIITGGSGLIGSAFAANLAASGQYEVIILSRNPAAHEGQQPKGVKLVEWDAKTAAGWGKLADGAYAIVNLAGAGIADKRWSAARKAVIAGSRADAGAAVVEAVRAAKNKPQVVLQISGVGYYGPRGDEVIDETGAPGDDFPARVCKDAWEPSTTPVRELGVRHVIMRTGIVLSKDGGALPRLVLPVKLLAGGPLGSGEQYYSWIHIDDQVRAMRFLLENPATHGVYNLTAPAPVTNKVMVTRIGTVLSRPTFAPAVPGFALKLLLGEMAGVVLDGQRAVPERLRQAGFRFRFADVETALRDVLKD